MKHLAPDKASLIALLLIERPMCLDCICEKVGVSTIEGDRYLTTIGAALALQRSEERPTEDEIDEPRDPLVLVLPSGVLHTQGFDVAPLSPEDIDRINTREVRLIVTATLSYTDVLNSDGLTHLVSVYLPGSETWVIAPEGNVMR
jgi:hypothetical protein